MKVLIVGAGLAGPLLAQGLVLAGVDVALYERDEHGQGYRIHLDPEGDQALRDCLPRELYDEAVATSGVRGSGVTILNPKLKVVQHFPAPPLDEDRLSSVDRVTLRRVLLTGLDVRHAEFERYELLADGRVRAHFAGEAADADLLVGADGTHSRVRAQLLPRAEVVETGQFLIFGKTPLTPEARALAPAASLAGFSAVAGKGRFMPLAAHQPRTGEPGYLMWVVGSTTRPTETDGAALRDAAARLVAKWHRNLAALINLAPPESVNRTTVRTAKPVPQWESGPVTLIGDAIHTMVPAGIGAAVALRDAALLCRRLTKEPLLDAVHAYETEMLDYGFDAVARSLNRG